MGVALIVKGGVNFELLNDATQFCTGSSPLWIQLASREYKPALAKLNNFKRRIFSYFLMINGYLNFFIYCVAIASLRYAFNFLSFGCIYDTAGHFYEILAVYIEKFGDFILASENYNSIIPPVFKSKRLTQICNSFSIASVVYFKPSDEILSNEPVENNTEDTGATVGTENDSERTRHAEQDALLDRQHPPAPSTAPSREPSTDPVEDWLETLEQAGVDVGTGRGYSYGLEEETFDHETKEGEEALQPPLEQEEDMLIDSEDETGSEWDPEQEAMDTESETSEEGDPEEEVMDTEPETSEEGDPEEEVMDTESGSGSYVSDLFDFIAGNSYEPDPK
jgi:hypothetical protein